MYSSPTFHGQGAAGSYIRYIIYSGGIRIMLYNVIWGRMVQKRRFLRNIICERPLSCTPVNVHTKRCRVHVYTCKRALLHDDLANELPGVNSSLVSDVTYRLTTSPHRTPTGTFLLNDRIGHIHSLPGRQC